MSSALRVSEVFGPTIQGEGPAAGQPAVFLRLGGCNLSCSWCDTPYTWDATRFDLHQEITAVPVAEITNRVRVARGLNTRIVVLTGGEPLLQQGPALTDLFIRIRALGMAVHIETNGTIAPNEETRFNVGTFVVSPKLSNAGQHRGHQDPIIHPAWSELKLHPGVHLKIVCEDAGDVHRAVTLAAEVGIPLTRTWVMPQGVTVKQLNARWPEIAQTAAKLGINASYRLHVAAWGDKRGH